MPVVVTCPACRQKARVPEAMLGQPVTCPACAATFEAPMATDPPPAEPPLVRPPLPADADALRAAKTGASVQLLAHVFNILTLACFAIVCLLAVSQELAFGMRSRITSALPEVLTMLGFVLLFLTGLLNLISCGLSELSPVARSARGWAIAALILAAFEFLQLILWAGWLPMLIDNRPNRFGSDWIYVLSGATAYWFVDVARLTVLALYWRCMFAVVRDRRGATLCRRLSIAGPLVHGLLVVAWLFFAFFGAPGADLSLLAVTGALMVQIILVFAGIGLVSRLRRRLTAVVPAEV
jgi:hypothetical protein